MQPRDVQQNWSHGDGNADVGTKAWAERVRLRMLGMVEHIGEDEERFLGYIELVREHRAWALLAKKDGSTFRTIEEFCAHPRPWGLGVTWRELRPHLVAGLAKRGMSQEQIERSLQLETVPEAMPEEEQRKQAAVARWTKGDNASRNDCGPDSPGLPKRTVEQLRAINRAPDVVKDAYREGRISQTLAAKLGPKNPKPEQAAKVAEIASEIRKVKDRKQVDQLVRERLGTREPTIVERAFKMVERMSTTERLDFDRQIRPLIAQAEGNR